MRRISRRQSAITSAQNSTSYDRSEHHHHHVPPDRQLGHVVLFSVGYGFGCGGIHRNTSPELVAVLGEQPGIETYDCHVEPGNYRVGDKVVDGSSNEYRIVGIERHENNEDTDDIYTLRLNKQATVYNE